MERCEDLPMKKVFVLALFIACGGKNAPPGPPGPCEDDIVVLPDGIHPTSSICRADQHIVERHNGTVECICNNDAVLVDAGRGPRPR